MKYIPAAAASASLLLGAHAAMADEILDYTGNNYTYCQNAPGCTADHMSGTLTLSLSGTALDNFNGYVPLADIVAFSFSDGLGHSWSDTNGASESIYIHTNSTGQIIEWDIQLFDKNYNIDYQKLESENVSRAIAPDDYAVGMNYWGVSVVEEPGIWNEFEQTVPEPATLALIGSGLAGMAAMRRRRRKKEHAAIA